MGSQSGQWHVIYDQHESLTIPPTWHKADHGLAYKAPGRSREGIWFLAQFVGEEVPRTAKMLTKVSPHIREWELVRKQQVTYYAVWVENGAKRAIQIRVPESQQTLGQTVLGSWQPG